MKQADANHTWIDRWMRSRGVALWGAADLNGFSVPPTGSGCRLAGAVTWAVPMPPDTMAGIQHGPTEAYARAYTRVNARINEIAERLAADIVNYGHQALPLAASERTDPVGVKGDFPHKTAATRAGLGWIGRHCQLVTRTYGPWVRLGTVFTDMPLLFGQPRTRGFCGRCRACVDACPAGALSGEDWYPGIERHKILNVDACDRWKKKHYFSFNKGHNCGICSAVCPYGLKRRQS